MFLKIELCVVVPSNLLPSYAEQRAAVRVPARRYFARDAPSIGRMVSGRDENEAETTDGTKWCHICFYIFIRKQKTNTEISETNIKMDTSGNIHEMNTV
jgi:hypothetical protein